MESSLSQANPASVPSLPSSPNPGQPRRNRDSVKASVDIEPSNHKRQRLNSPKDTNEESSSRSSSNFLFVNAHDALPAAQRPRSDQKAINAHIQQTAYRQRRQAASERLKHNHAANVGSLRSHTLLQAPPRSSAAFPPQLHHAVSSRTESDVVRYQPNRLGRFDPSHIDALTKAVDEDNEPSGEREHTRTPSMRTILAEIFQRLGPPPLSAAVHGSPISVLDSALIDPFANGSVSITREMNALLRHYSETMVPGAFPIRAHASAQIKWALLLASEKPAMLYAVLAVSSAELEARSGRLGENALETTYTEQGLVNRKVPDFVGYRYIAIKTVNESMGVKEQETEVAMIYALMCLLSIECITGNMKDIATHVSGLQRLLAWRGGYHGLPPWVTESVLSSTYMCAAMTRSLPPAPPSLTLPGIPSSKFDTIAAGIGTHLKLIGVGLLHPGVEALFDWRVSQAFNELREVTLYREYYHEQGTLPAACEHDFINAKIYQLLYLVLTIPFEVQNPGSDKQEPCRIALLIFWNANYTLTRPDSATFRALTTQLRSALQKSDLKSFWAPHLDLLMWVLFLGAYISAGQRERPWFVMNIARGARLLNWQDWSDARAALLRFFYLDRIYSKGCQAVWEEAKLLGDMIGIGFA